MFLVCVSCLVLILLLGFLRIRRSCPNPRAAEAELRAIADNTCEISWMQLLLSELQIPQTLPITINCDNQTALNIAADPVFHPKTKHFAIDCHYVRE